MDGLLKDNLLKDKEISLIDKIEKKESKSKFKEIAFILIFLSSVIVLERLFKTKLIEYSRKIEPELSKKFKETRFLKFLLYIQDIGHTSIAFQIIILISPFFSLVKIFSLFALIYSQLFAVNFLKMVYGEERPFWRTTKMDEMPLSCYSSFGNPSGHSSMSTCFAFGLWSVFTHHKFFEKKIGGKVIKYLSLPIFLFIPALTMLTRMTLGAHSLNQVLFGSSLGFSVYFLYFQILNIHEIKASNFFRTLNSVKIYVYCIFGICLLLVILIYFLLNRKKIEIFKAELLKKSFCHPDSFLFGFNNDGLLDCLSSFSLVVIYTGFLILGCLTEKKSVVEDNNNGIVNWQKQSLLRRIIQSLMLLVISFSFYFIRIRYLHYLTDGNNFYHALAVETIVDYNYSLIVVTYGFYLGKIISDLLFGKKHPAN